MFILAGAYPTTPPDITSTFPPFSSTRLSLRLAQAVLHTLVGEHLYMLQQLLWLCSSCHPPFRHSLHHLSICPMHRRHRNVILVPLPFIRASSEHPLFASISRKPRRVLRLASLLRRVSPPLFTTDSDKRDRVGGNFAPSKHYET